MGKKDRLAHILNDRTFLLQFQQLENYALSLFEWKGLPKSVNVLFMERTLLSNGNAVFFDDPGLGFMCLPVMTGRINYYNEPITFKAWSIDYNRDLDLDSGVIIWNNYARTPILPILELYAMRLTEIQRTIDVNMNAQKTPVLVRVPHGQLLTLENIYAKYDGNSPVIFGDKDAIDPNALEAIKTDAPYVIDKLTDYKHDLWNEVMTFLGIGNANQDKKERLVSDEVSANDEQVEGARHVMLQARQDACDKINELFGLNVSVDYKLKQEEGGQGGEPGQEGGSPGKAS